MNNGAHQDSSLNGGFGTPGAGRRLLPFPSSVRANLLAVLLALLIPLLLLQAYVSFRNYEERLQQQLEANLEIARAAAVAFDGYVQDVLHEELALGTAITSASAPPSDVDGYLKVNADQYPSLREFFWSNPQGRIVASSNAALLGVEIGDRDYYQAVTGGKEWAVSDLLQAKVGGEPVFVIARGVRDGNGRLQGIMAATVLPDELGATLPIERSGAAAVSAIDRQGRLVYRSPSVPLSWDRRGATQRQPMTSQALAGAEATGSYPSEIDGQGRMGGLAPIRSIGWAARATQPTEDVTGPLLRDILRDAGLFLLISLAALATAWVVSQRITRPLGRLEEQATAIAGGESGVQVEAAGPAEMRSLAGAFNQMSKEIRLHQERLAAETVRSRQLAHEAQRRAAELDAANKELEAFSYSVSHDLRAPLRTIDGFSKALLEDYAEVLDENGQRYLEWVRTGSQRMGRLIDDMLALSRVTRSEMRRERVDLSAIAREVGAELQRVQPESRIELAVAPGVTAEGDSHLLRLVMQNLLGNAWKFTSKREAARVEFGVTDQEGNRVYFVRDNGVGFDMAYADKLFRAFQRLHSEEDFPGTGVGLATVQRILRRHGGRIWPEAAVDQGATFYFTLNGGI